jgi:hypothetical protein
MIEEIVQGKSQNLVNKTFSGGMFHSAIKNRVEELLNDVERYIKTYKEAKPYPHIVLDNFLPDKIADLILDEFPAADSNIWTKLPTEDQKGKFVAKDESQFPLNIRLLIHELNSGTFLKFLEQLTGMTELITDAKIAGGGLHRIEQGGKLSVHVDFSHHPTNGLNRRINLLLFLNKNWQEEYGGNFELWTWDKGNKKCEKRVLPIFNRCVIFSTTPTSYHGHPEPLNCPDSESRKSIALYYFSNGRPAEEDIEHNTLFKTRPNEQTSLGTLLVRAASSGLFRDLMPPILYRYIRKIWNQKFTIEK